MGGSTCCVIGCSGRSHDGQGKKINNGMSFYSFPAWRQNQGSYVSHVTKGRRMAWISAVGRLDLKFSNIPRSYKVCSRHFHSGKPAYEMDESHPDWAPTLHLGHFEDHATESHQQSHQLKKGKMEVTAADGVEGENQAENEVCGKWAEVVVAVDEDHGDQDEEEAAEDEVAHEPTAKRPKTECQFCERSSAEIDRLLQENKELRCELNKRRMDEHFLEANTDKVQYYTGLPCFAILVALFNNVKPSLPVTKNLSPFQMILLTLMRLRLDLPVQHLAHLFSVSCETLSTAFADTVDVLYAHLNPLVHWPERHCLQATKPQKFLEAFGQRAVIIVDCFEIRTERQSDVKSHPLALSHSKSMDTMKYLIGITPQGAISFISKGWEGHSSDMHITENCGLLNKLSPGDIVLADRGFDIKESVGLMCAEVKAPAITNGQCQLDAKDEESTRAIAHLRVHVGRVIDGMRNKYTMLHKTIPASLLLPCEGEEMTLLDKIVNVCFILINMCPNVAAKPDES
ncbi:uncharacterized protein LOC125889147 [Epinephelus fuscoguttatus]|uniref:uncharacterized protein LOC125889147 n=1 Tax=Epinephelus fuscoguttatus TaxID=293821 RepID=UPI0020D09E51|nr:uncharacterized protein LOC125889147 [Epinephelus fuscoguttatus]